MRLPHVRRPVGALERDGRLGQSLALPLPLCQGVSPLGFANSACPGQNQAFAGRIGFCELTGRALSAHGDAPEDRSADAARRPTRVPTRVRMPCATGGKQCDRDPISQHSRLREATSIWALVTSWAKWARSARPTEFMHPRDQGHRRPGDVLTSWRDHAGCASELVTGVPQVRG
jgi:hypothetical protein